jgi:hypothetical protein
MVETGMTTTMTTTTRLSCCGSMVDWTTTRRRRRRRSRLLAKPVEHEEMSEKQYQPTGLETTETTKRATAVETRPLATMRTVEMT